MKKSGDYYRDVTVGVCYLSGLFGFMSGAFVVSAALFGTASLISNMNFERELVEN